MNQELSDKIRKGLEEERAIDDIRTSLVSQGFLEDEVMDAIQEIHFVQKSSDDKRKIKLFTLKEVFDRVGYGFASIQFINILFYLTGAGFFLIGLINGLKTILSILISSFLQEYSKVRRVSIKFISYSGILFGLSFLFIAMAAVIKSPMIFSIALLIGSLGVVTYGDLYTRLTEEHLKKEKLGKFFLRISHYGIIITGVSLLLSGFLFDAFPIAESTRLNIFGKSLPIYGYLISFEITAIAFILSGYFLQFIKEKKIVEEKAKKFLTEYFSKIKYQVKLFVKNKYIMLLLLASSIAGLVQILGNSYYGIFIYDKFITGSFSGVVDGVFVNITIMLIAAILVSFLGPAFSEYVNRKVGLAPTLVFGTLLVSLMPLVSAYNPRFINITLANAISILGSAILGTGQGLLVRKLLREEERKLYYAALSTGVVIPFLIIIPLGAWIAQAYGLTLLFKLLAFTLLLIAAPIYFVLVLFANKFRL
jgi:hypothetical protein